MKALNHLMVSQLIDYAPSKKKKLIVHESFAWKTNLTNDPC